jgi:hypothetical protein
MCMPPDSRIQIMQAIAQLGAAHVARLLGVRREALLGYLVGASREATAIVIEQRLNRLGTAPGAT